MLGTQVMLPLSIHLMAPILSLAHMTSLLGFGMQPLVSVWEIHFKGTHVASGSYDKTIRVWNATTGQYMAGPFEGHISWITSVAYSPDGIHVVSGSVDKTIRVWSATTGQCVGNPLKGHRRGVNSVAYIFI